MSVGDKSRPGGCDADFERFFFHSLNLLAVAGFDGFYKRLNPAWATATGYSLEELMARPFIELVHPDDRDATIREAARLAQGEQSVSFENRYIKKDGSTLWLVWNATSWQAEERIYASAQDISELKRAEGEVSDILRKLQTVLDEAVDGIITIDERGIIESFNNAAVRIFGHSPDEVIGRNVSVLMPEPNRSAHDSYIARYRGDGESRIIGVGREVVGLRRDGRTFPADLAISEVWLDGRRIFTGFVRDISERKEIERMKDEFVSTVSHELRTPLTSIGGSVKLLGGGVGGDISVQAKELVSVASRNADRLVRLVNDILDLEKIEAGKMDLRLSDLDAGELARSSAASIQGVASAAGVEILVEGRDAPLRGDADRLVQVLVNLLSNAIKFSPSGAEVSLSFGHGKDRATRFAVKDNGPGIAEEEQHRLFSKFEQIDGSDARSKGGTGLGLAICKAIVEQHGGSIGVESRLGEGALFWFEIPHKTSVCPT